ncbi:integral membrane protein [Fusarium heterosporum]|uniref:Integral membrane protein n=1 Tax=Fusarium heterosporum TaxID=42747 RepID=A0A8H5TEK0_FUSHE|nr:integral membrane protein [Fusarium heterosporum]
MNITAEQAARSYESESELMVGVASGLIALGILLVAMRLRCRLAVKGLGLDDIFIVFALACFIACGSSMIAMTFYGLGKHVWTLSPKTMVFYGRCFWLSILFYGIAIYAVKMAFLLQYYRIMSVTNMRWVYIGFMAVMTLWCVCQLFVVCLLCIPLEAAWDPSIEGKCIKHQTTMWYVNGILHIIFDFAIIVMPLPIVWKLNLPRSQKFLLSGIFGLGIFTVAIAILRLKWLTPEPDVSWWNVTPASWSLAEIVSGIACACLPTYKPLLVKLKTWIPRVRKGDSTDCIQDQVVTGDTDTTLVEMQDIFAGQPKVSENVPIYGTQTSISADMNMEAGSEFKKTKRGLSR